MVIRPARLDDAAAIAVLTTQLGYPNLPEETRGRLRDVLDRPDGAVFVAETEGSVAGWIYVFGTHLLETDPFALIAGLVVDETLRSQGIGAALVGAATDWAEQHGYRTLRVGSNVVRERAHDFYERLGFSRAKNQVVFVRPTAPEE
jgi:GNAT superfamily N-acetyltransferase